MRLAGSPAALTRHARRSSGTGAVRSSPGCLTGRRHSPNPRCAYPKMSYACRTVVYMGTDNRLQFRIDDQLSVWLDRRAESMRNGGSLDLQARLELGLWQSALHLELRRIRLTLPQACCIADVCNGWLMDASLAAGIGMVYAQCYDAFRIARDVPAGLDPDISSYGAKWGQRPDGLKPDPRAWEEDLLARLISLSPVADHALRDAITRWWEDGHDSTVAGFERVGLRVTEISEEQQS